MYLHVMLNFCYLKSCAILFKKNPKTKVVFFNNYIVSSILPVHWVLAEICIFFSFFLSEHWQYHSFLLKFLIAHVCVMLVRVKSFKNGFWSEYGRSLGLIRNFLKCLDVANCDSWERPICRWSILFLSVGALLFWLF